MNNKNTPLLPTLDTKRLTQLDTIYIIIYYHLTINERTKSKLNLQNKN